MTTLKLDIAEVKVALHPSFSNPHVVLALESLRSDVEDMMDAHYAEYLEYAAREPHYAAGCLQARDAMNKVLIRIDDLIAAHS